MYNLTCTPDDYVSVDSDLRFTRQSSLNDHQDVGSDYCGPCKTLKKPFGAPVSKGEASAQREIQSKPGKGKPIKRVTPTPLLKAKPPPPMGTDVKKRSSAHQPTSQVHTKSGTSKAAPAHHIMLSQNAKKQQSPVPHGETGNEQSGNAGSSNFNKFTSNIQPRSMPGPANPVNEQALTMFPPSRIVYNGGYGNSTGGVRNAPTLPVNLPTRALNNSPGPAQSAPLTAAELQFQLDLDEWERNHPL